MKSLQNNYILIKEGKGSRELFIKQAKREFPQYISNVQTYDQTVNSLRERGIITESINRDVTSKNTEPNWFKIFNSTLTEAKATEKKATKEVTDLEEKNFNYKDDKNIDNLIGGEVLTGFYAEMKDPKNLEKTIEELKAIVAKNLAKDPLYYVKDGQFGVKGLGYTQQDQKEAKGKYKASGYGDITENTIKKNLNEAPEIPDDITWEWDGEILAQIDVYDAVIGLEGYSESTKKSYTASADASRPGPGADWEWDTVEEVEEEATRANSKVADSIAESKALRKLMREHITTKNALKELTLNENQVVVTKKEWPYVEFKDGETVHKVEFEYGDMIDDYGNEGQDQYWIGEDENGQEWELDIDADYQGNVQYVHYDTITKA